MEPDRIRHISLPEHVCHVAPPGGSQDNATVPSFLLELLFVQYQRPHVPSVVQEQAKDELFMVATESVDKPYGHLVLDVVFV